MTGPAEIARLTGPRQLDWTAEDLPEQPGPTEILCRTLATAISPGTEVAAWTGAPPLRPGPVYPRLQGYCNVAEVTGAGTEVWRLTPGTRVLTHQSHRSGFVCNAGDVLAVLPDGMDPGAAATAYLFHLGLAAVQKAGVAAGHAVAVLGLGPLGLGAIAMARLAGAAVFGASRRPGLTPLAQDFGAEAVLAEDGPVFDVVITTANGWGDWRRALSLARPGGIVAVLGFPGRGQGAPEDNPLDSALFYDKQLTLVACGQVPRGDLPMDVARFTLKRNMAWLVDRIAAGDIPAERMISERMAPSGLAGVYDRLAAREAGLLTAVLEW